LKKEKKPTIRYANQPFYASQCGWIRAQMTTMMTMTRMRKMMERICLFCTT